MFKGVVLETTLTCEVESDCANDRIFYEDRIVTRANHSIGDRTSYTNVVTDITSNDDVYIVQSGNTLWYYNAHTDVLIDNVTLTKEHMVCELVEIDTYGQLAVSVCGDTTSIGSIVFTYLTGTKATVLLEVF